MKTVILKTGRENSIQRKHPWLFSGAIKAVEGDPKPGETVDVYSTEGKKIAVGAYSPHSQIRVRIWSFDPDTAINPDFFFKRITEAIHFRKALLSRTELTACRLVYGESDGLPGLIVDRYNNYLVCQFLSAGAEYWKETIVHQLIQISGLKNLYERSEGSARQKEGLEIRSGVLSGEEPDDLIEISHDSVRYLVDVKRGHKTGFYLDQARNHRLVSAFSAEGEVLNCFSYTGAFGIWALKGKAKRVVNIETSAYFNDIARQNFELNFPNAPAVEYLSEDVFQTLRKFRDSRQEFDLIILDPPKFAETAAQVQQASRGYKDINLLALKLLRPGGTLFTFSCSGHVELKLFQKIVADAALDAQREVRIVQYLGQSMDHPVSLNFPEGNYLKGLICKVI
ncbi:MAG: class I SAM-dependent methyltransferase [Calditrichia bacterium]